MEKTEAPSPADLGQPSSAGEDDRQQTPEGKSQIKSTDKATKSGIKKFVEWLILSGRKCNLATVTAKELNDVLYKYYKEVKHNDHKKGKTLKPSTLICLRAALHRHLISPPLLRPFNVINGKDFAIANRMFAARCDIYLRNAKPQRKIVTIEKKDIEKLAQYFSAWKTSPQVLVEAVWFNICYFFGRRNREDWAQMTKDTFMVETSAEGRRFVSIKKPDISTDQRGKIHSRGFNKIKHDSKNVRMFWPGAEIYEYYIARTNTDCKRLFQTPSRFSTTCTGQWYRNEPIGKNTLGNIMQRISQRTGLSKIYSCDSVATIDISALFFWAGNITSDIQANMSRTGEREYQSRNIQDQEGCGQMTEEQPVEACIGGYTTAPIMKDTTGETSSWISYTNDEMTAEEQEYFDIRPISVNPDIKDEAKPETGGIIGTCTAADTSMDSSEATQTIKVETPVVQSNSTCNLQGGNGNVTSVLNNVGMVPVVIASDEDSMTTAALTGDSKLNSELDVRKKASEVQENITKDDGPEGDLSDSGLDTDNSSLIQLETMGDKACAVAMAVNTTAQPLESDPETDILWCSVAGQQRKRPQDHGYYTEIIKKRLKLASDSSTAPQHVPKHATEAELEEYAFRIDYNKLKAKCDELTNDKNAPMDAASLPALILKELHELKVENQKLLVEKTELCVARQRLTREMIQKDVECKKWTGFSCYRIFKGVFKKVMDVVKRLGLKDAVDCSLCPEDRFLMTLVYLRTGNKPWQLSWLFLTNDDITNNILETWIDFMHSAFKDIFETKSESTSNAARLNAKSTYAVCMEKVCMQLDTSLDEDTSVHKFVSPCSNGHGMVNFMIGVTQQRSISYIVPCESNTDGNVDTLQLDWMKAGDTAICFNGLYLIEQDKPSKNGVESETPDHQSTFPRVFFKGRRLKQLVRGKTKTDERNVLRSQMFYGICVNIVSHLKLEYEILEGFVYSDGIEHLQKLVTVCAFLHNFEFSTVGFFPRDQE